MWTWTKHALACRLFRGQHITRLHLLPALLRFSGGAQFQANRMRDVSLAHRFEQPQYSNVKPSRTSKLPDALRACVAKLQRRCKHGQAWKSLPQLELDALCSSGPH
eukprot:3584279-Amphidinium_carterae.1